MTHTAVTSKTTLARFVLWAARILGTLTILFLLFMILGHIFGSEPQRLNGLSDVIALTFFPTGLLVGLIVALKYEKTGGAIAFISMCIFFAYRPNALTSNLFLLIFAPAVLFFVYGWWLEPRHMQEG